MVSTRQSSNSNTNTTDGSVFIELGKNIDAKMVSTRQSSNSNTNTADGSVLTELGKNHDAKTVSTRQSSNSSTNTTDGSVFIEFGKTYDAKTVSTRQSNSSNTNTADSSIYMELGKNYDAVPTSSSRRNPPQPGPSNTNVQVEENTNYINLLDLPVEILQKILGYLEYNTIAHLRPVCHKFDKVCGSILNSTFQRLQTQTLARFQAIKAQMPRRESARRNHALAFESEIIETLHMRLALLQMGFGKHIERKHCCFFPGEILDEVCRILHYIKVTPKLARPCKVIDELYELSSMAMEYFKDCIEPTLPEIPYFGAKFLDLTGTFSSSSTVNKYSLCLDTAPLSVSDGKGHDSGGEGSPSRFGNDEPGGSGSLDAIAAAPVSPPQSNMVLRKRIRKIKQGMKRYNSQLSLMRRDLRTCKAKIAEQQKQIILYATRLDENDKKNEETSRKFSTLLQELNKCKTELQYWRSKSPAIPMCSGCSQTMSVTSEDLQVDQSVVSNVETSTSEGLDFIPIADVSVHSPTEREMDSMLDLQTPSQLQPTQQLQLQQQLQSQPQSQTQLPLQAQPQLQQQLQQQTLQPQQQQAHSSSSSNCNNIPLVEPMAPPKAPPSSSATSISLPLISSKRKSNSSCPEEDAVKKPRRALKSRQAKRTKI